MKYTRIPENTFKNLQLNAGIIAKNFTPDTGEVQENDLVGPTSGGVNFTAEPTYEDFGSDIDNCPTNVKELKRLTEWAVNMSGTFIALDTAAGKMLVGAADVNGNKITPRNDVDLKDFQDLWWIGDYSDINEDGSQDGKAGFVAVHMLNALSTGGFQIQSGNREKGQFEFEFTGHYSIDAQDTVPFEVYISAGTNDAE